MTKKTQAMRISELEKQNSELLERIKGLEARMTLLECWGKPPEQVAPMPWSPLPYQLTVSGDGSPSVN